MYADQASADAFWDQPAVAADPAACTARAGREIGLAKAAEVAAFWGYRPGGADGAVEDGRRVGGIIAALVGHVLIGTDQHQRGAEAAACVRAVQVQPVQRHAQGAAPAAARRAAPGADQSPASVNSRPR